MLERTFDEVHGAQDAAHALKLLGVWRYDFVLVDMGLQPAISRQLIRSLKEISTATFVVAVVDSWREREEVQMADRVFVKPAIGALLHSAILQATEQL